MSVFQQYALWVQIARKAPYIKMDSQQASRHKDKEKSDTDLKVMMPYLSQYLGHKGPVETYYYYHQVQEIFETIRRKDKISSRVIPEVRYEKD